MGMEIERKWMVDGWPGQDLPLEEEFELDQGYLSTAPVVRIRREAEKGGDTQYILCIKSAGRLARREIEIPVEKNRYEELREMIGLPLIHKVRRTYLLPDGNRLEVNHVDAGRKEAFWYAEVEFSSVKEAHNWDPETVGLGDYLSDDVTDLPGQSMSYYWIETRLSGGAREAEVQ